MSSYKPPRYKKNPINYQILTDTGETVGLGIDKFEVAERVLLGIINDAEYLQDLCPDTNINTIKTLEIVPYIGDTYV